MTELNENKTNEQNISKNESKKKRSKITILIILVLIGVVGYVGYELASYFVEQNTANSLNEKLQTVEVGHTYTYSEEEKEAFRQEAQKVMDKQVAEKDLKPGESYYVKGLEGEGYGFEGINEYDFMDGVAYVLQRSSFFYNNNLITNWEYSGDNMNAGSFFNEDLSLRHPELFYGYASISVPYGELGATEGFNEEDVKEWNQESFNEFVAIMKGFDNKFKNSSNGELLEFLNKLGDMNTVFSNESSIAKLSGVDNLEDYLLGTDYYKYLTWLSEDSKNSINALSTFVQLEPNYFNTLNNTVSNELFEFDEPLVKNYELYPDKYNYFTENKDYFTLYVPSSISKIGEHTYLVEVEVDRPIDNLGYGMIMGGFYTKIKASESELHLDDIGVDVIVKAVYKNDPNKVNSLGFGYGDILHNNHEAIYNIDGKTVFAASNALSGTSRFWYPSEEAMLWANDYFARANEAYENDLYFSIFETILDLSNEYDVPENDMISVIMSCYYRLFRLY